MSLHHRVGSISALSDAPGAFKWLPIHNTVRSHFTVWQREMCRMLNREIEMIDKESTRNETWTLQLDYLTSCDNFMAQRTPASSSVCLSVSVSLNVSGWLFVPGSLFVPGLLCLARCMCLTRCMCLVPCICLAHCMCLAHCAWHLVCTWLVVIRAVKLWWALIKYCLVVSIDSVNCLMQIWSMTMPGLFEQIWISGAWLVQHKNKTKYPRIFLIIFLIWPVPSHIVRVFWWMHLFCSGRSLFLLDQQTRFSNADSHRRVHCIAKMLLSYRTIENRFHIYAASEMENNEKRLAWLPS